MMNDSRRNWKKRQQRGGRDSADFSPPRWNEGGESL